MMVKFFTKSQLELVNNDAECNNRNHIVHRDKIRVQPRTTLFPIIMSFIHNDCEVRTVVMLNKECDIGLVDMTFEQYRALQTAEVPLMI